MWRRRRMRRRCSRWGGGEDGKGNFEGGGGGDGEGGKGGKSA
jgi:hypothetical protein